MKDNEGNRTCDHCGKRLPTDEFYRTQLLDICPDCARGKTDPAWREAELDDLRAEVDRLTILNTQHERHLQRLHALLDKEGIPRAEHVPCDDPECWSLLYHRIKHGVIAREKAATERLTNVLGTKPPSLPLVDLDTGEPLTVEQVLGAQKEIARLNALLTSLQKQVRTDALVNRYRVLCRDIRDAHRGKGKWTLDDYVDRFEQMFKVISHTTETEEDST